MTATPEYSKPVATAREYYNSSDADNFYFTIWGGEDIHIGLYEHDDEDIRAASTRTVETLTGKLTSVTKDTRILDIGAGYGGAARYLAKRFGCKVTALNLSEVENERDRQMNKEQGLDPLVEVVDGSFQTLDFPDNSFDVVWSQDAILHSDNREQVLQEVARVLKPGGEFIFTDPMRTDDCPEGVLQPILDRIHLEDLGCPGFYRQVCEKLGFKEFTFEAHPEQLTNHYSRVLAETEKREAEIAKVVSEDYIAKMKKGLGHWIDGGREGYLTWGIFHCKA